MAKQHHYPGANLLRTYRQRQVNNTATTNNNNNNNIIIINTPHVLVDICLLFGLKRPKAFSSGRRGLLFNAGRSLEVFHGELYKTKSF